MTTTAANTGAKPSTLRPIPADMPIIDYDHSKRSAPLAHWTRLDEFAKQAPIVWNDFGPGFWMVMDYELVKEAYQTPEIFTSDSIIATDPNPQHQWIPTMVNAPDHVKYRQILNPVFSPGAVAKHEPHARMAVNRIIDRFIDEGSVEVMNAFCGDVPTEIFLGMIGLPMADASMVATWVADVFDHVHDLDHAPMLAALSQIGEYFGEKLAERRAHPDRASRDIVALLVDAQIDGQSIPDADILNICNTLTLAGLDTVRAQLGHAFLHLATHPSDRERLLREPELWPSAVEEMLRLYAIVSNDSRKVGADVDFHGCPMKKGDMAMMALGPACRDARFFADPLTFVPDREHNRHLAFAAGPHRCLGSHIARMELLVALQEWHRRIPEYRVAPGGLGEERGSQMSLLRLDLEWDV